MKALSTRNDEPDRASRPFDARRDGFVIGEGAAVLVLEELESARRRGAPILAELAGFGATTDAHHMTQPHPEGDGAVRAMRGACADAGLEPAAIGYVNAHGTSTPPNDRVETLALKRLFGERVPPVSSTKSMTGHTLGAAGALEAVISVQALNHSDRCRPPSTTTSPTPTATSTTCPTRPARRPWTSVMTNSFGFGGHNASLVFRRI